MNSNDNHHDNDKRDLTNKDNEQEMTVAQYPGVDNAGNATYTEGKDTPFAAILQQFWL